MKHIIDRFLITSMFAFFVGDVSANTHVWKAHKWMSEIHDSIAISTLSIPGAHDAATGEGLCVNIGLGKTQCLSIAQQWDCGVRFFDLRPALCDTVLHIYHGTLRTQISFAEAIDIILSKLAANPSDFAIVLIRHESESEDDEEKSNWSRFVGAYIQSLGNKAVSLHPRLTLGEVRGKILFLTRNPYNDCGKGGLISGWTHSAEGTTGAKIISYASSEFSFLQIHDYYAPTNNDKRLQKKQGVFRMLEKAQTAEEDVWTMNFLSGYASTWMGTGLFATTSGYKRNAAWLHPLVMEYITNCSSSNGYGIVFMDFVGIDKVPGSFFHWTSFNIQGKKLLDAIIQTNF